MTLDPAVTLAAISEIGIVPVVVIDDPDRAVDLANALVAGGIPCAEITLRTPGGLLAIEAMSSVQDFVLGAGTVLTVDQVDRCADAGATFVVSPGYDPDVVERAQHLGMAVLPGVATATEIQRAIRAGLDVVKFFPAGRLGGLDTIESLAAPFPDIRFVPSGGIGPGNAAEYLASPSIFAISGSWMVSRELLARSDFTEVERLSLAAAAIARSRP